ncbi:MAG TPA: hypothetical protein VGD65_15505 [Chryseosolibacter sp.]
MAALKKSFIVLSFVLFASSAFGQPGSNPGGGTKPGTVPISGIEILIAIGGLVGLKKIFDSKKSR